MPKKFDRCVEKVRKKSKKVNPYAVCRASLSLKRRMNKHFSKEEQRVLKILNYTYYGSQNQWSLNKGEMFVVETQLGYSTYKARKMVIKALDIFEEYPEKQVLKWLGY